MTDEHITTDHNPLDEEPILSETKTSRAISALFSALAAAQGEMDSAAKDKKNPYFKSLYADLQSVRDVIREPFAKHGLCIVQMPELKDGRVLVTTRLAHKSGEWIESSLSMKPDKDTPQAIGSCITYARRYAMLSMCGVAPADDDDGESAEPREPTPGFDPNHNAMKSLKATLHKRIGCQTEEDADAIVRWATGDDESSIGECDPKEVMNLLGKQNKDHGVAWKDMLAVAKGEK